MSGLTGKLYTAKQVRRLDACAIDAHGIAGIELMRRAGQALFDEARGFAPEARQWIIFCGAGNNAGDGYVVARLAAKAGLEVTVVALKAPEQLRGDARGAAEAWAAEGGAVLEFGDFDADAKADLVVDALLGTGLERDISGAYSRAVQWINQGEHLRVAVDIPTGLNADTGAIMGDAVRADLTVSFIGLKRGLFTGDGPDCAGRLAFADLDVPRSVYDAAKTSGELIHETQVKGWLRPRRRNAHKGDFGHVLVVGGDHGMSGAPRLAGEASLRTGAGLVSIATRGDHAAQVNAGRPELMVHACGPASELDPLLARASVVAIGPGLGTGSWSRDLLRRCLDCGLPCVIDADALNLLASGEYDLSDGIRVLTPHPGEAARLLQTSADAIQGDRVSSALALAERYGAVAVLKGCGTVVADSDARYAICSLGNPGMATAGSGDVLTGVIAALLAQGLEAWQAASAGVALHAAAGDRAADRLGQRSLLAGDIIDNLHRVLR